MAERLKHRLLDQPCNIATATATSSSSSVGGPGGSVNVGGGAVGGLVDVVCGPDAYRHLPRLLATTHDSGLPAGNYS